MAELRHLIKNPNELRRLKEQLADYESDPSIVAGMDESRLTDHLLARGAILDSQHSRGMKGKLRGRNPIVDEVLDTEVEEAITRELRAKLLHWQSLQS
jgi:hypothetical protein